MRACHARSRNAPMSRRYDPQPDPDQDDVESDSLPEPPSKSQLKRELVALQALVTQLAELSEAQLAGLSLDADVHVAVVAVRDMQRGARQRQVRYASRLLARSDSAAVLAALDDLQRPRVEEVRHFHQLERWREALLAGDNEVVAEIATQAVGLDRQHLMQLVREARQEQRDGRTPKASRRLFRYLGDLTGAT